MYSDLRAKKIEDTKMTESVPTNTYKAYKFDIKHSNLSERTLAWDFEEESFCDFSKRKDRDVPRRENP